MARPKKVSSDTILDAVEQVVVRLGASRLSIDTVAQEAGISKSRVVLDFKSKTALIEALVDRDLRRESSRIESAVVACADTPHPELFARLKLAEQAPDDTERAVVLAITSSMSGDAPIQLKVREWVARELQAMDAGANPELARLAYFALIGFGCHDWFGLAEWSQEERRSFMELVRSTYLSGSEAARLPFSTHPKDTSPS